MNYIYLFILFNIKIVNSNLLFVHNSIIKNKINLNYKKHIIDYSPCVYIDKENINNRILTNEHIFPISHMKKNNKFDNYKYAKNDMHNLFKTTEKLNSIRSNYKFTDIENECLNENWRILENNNYINNKKKLFIPANNSKGIIARAILHMSYKYNYKIEKIIDLNILIKWTLKYSPKNDEIYHNNLIKSIQYTDNIFIKNYSNNKKILNIYINKIKKNVKNK
tara:strand:- start:251 stop:916 length:666 start_codon:yes stop_codon:yes gene_type:complete